MTRLFDGLFLGPWKHLPWAAGVFFWEKQMKIREYAVFIIVLIVFFGCDSGAPVSKKGPDKGKGFEKMAFVASSEGLPATGQWREGLAFFDINNDGHTDILAPRPRLATKEYGGAVVWYGDGKGKWSEFPLDMPPDIGYDYGSIAVSDFDGDGTADIALGIHSQGVKVFRGTGDGKYMDFSVGIPKTQEFVSKALVSADFTNDGISDIAAASEASFGGDNALPSGGRVFSWSKEGWRSFRIGDPKEVKGLFADQLTTGDVNGDGNRDIAIASSVHWKDLIVWLGDGKGGFTPFNKGLPQEVHYPSVALADINGDAKDDLIASIAGLGKKSVAGIRAFLSGPEGFTDTSAGLPDEEVFLALCASDIDGDGSIEIVGGTGKGGLRLFTRKGDQWQEISGTGLPDSGLQRISNVYLIDLNQDGKRDVVVNYAFGHGTDDGGIRVFLNTPT